MSPAAPVTLPDLEPLWMPFTANRQFKKDPRLLVAAEGMYYTAHDGRRILDGIAGLWCCNAGHCHPKIVAAVREQAGRLDYATAFNLGHPAAFELAGQVAALAPGSLDHVFFVNSGSEAVDTALKIALAYHRARGEAQRTRLIGRERGYHGVGFGGISVGGIVANRRMFSASMLPGVDHLPHTHDLAHNAFSRGQPAWGAHLADDLERIVALHDPSTIAAVIVEPVAGSAGVLPPPAGYLERLRAICDRHGILLILDEVITGFGRTGANFAAQTFGVQPDLMTVAKGITSGVVPMGAVLVDRRIYDAFMTGPDYAVGFFHGYTYSGHPLAAAAGLAALEVYREEGLFERARRLAPVFEEALHGLRGCRHVIDIRNLGLMGAVELAPRAGEPTQRAMDVFRRCYDAGVLVRTTGDILALTPPLIISESEIAQIVDTLRGAIQATA
ncbi:MAG: aspartate aminotransferase family protein [Gammaproteobacteria bacterium]|nr:aspartate aminotransferase family protein [Gammaproteobacteria bacterium]